MTKASGTVSRILKRTARSLRKRRGDTGSIRLLLVGETDIWTGSLHGLGDSEDSRADGMRRTEYSRDFELGSEIIRNSFGDTHPLNISVIDPPDPQLANI